MNVINTVLQGANFISPYLRVIFTIQVDTVVTSDQTCIAVSSNSKHPSRKYNARHHVNRMFSHVSTCDHMRFTFYHMRYRMLFMHVLHVIAM